MKKFEIHYTEQYKAVIYARTKEDALWLFHEERFDADQSEYVDGTTTLVGEVEELEDA